MASAIEINLTKHRTALLAALAAGRPGSQPPEEAWPEIESVIRRCRKRMRKAQTAKEKERSTHKLADIVSMISEISKAINSMNEREKKWFCRELGRGSETPSARDARARGYNILNAYLTTFDNISNSASAAIISIKRKKNNAKSAASRLIIEVWQKIYGNSVLYSTKKRNFNILINLLL